MDFLSKYDSTTATAADDATRKEYLLDMLKGEDAGRVHGIMGGIGYSGLSKLKTKDNKGNVVWKEEYLDKNGNLDIEKASKVIKSERQTNTTDILKTTLGRTRKKKNGKYIKDEEWTTARSALN